MRYIVDHDYHIHSNLSPCGKDPMQTTESLLKYAEDNGFRRIVITDHFWDGDVKPISAYYQDKGFDRITKALPLPQSEKVEFCFGCEADMDENLNIGLAPQNYDKLDFIVVATTHMHFWTAPEATVPERTKIYLARLEKFLESDLPMQKVGIAHLTDPLIGRRGIREDHIAIIKAISDETFANLFKRAQKLGTGIELNMELDRYTDKDLAEILRPYQIAKQCGCKFYFGSDGHTTEEMVGTKERFEKIVDLLELTEDDKFDF